MEHENKEVDASCSVRFAGRINAALSVEKDVIFIVLLIVP